MSLLNPTHNPLINTLPTPPSPIRVPLMASSSSSSSSSGSPCGACKFLRRKCAQDCIFAPYFNSEHGSARFSAIHKVFGASNVSKLLSQLPVGDRCEAVITIAYEAQARLRDPVYGCVAHVFALQQQVAYLQTQLMQMKLVMGGNTPWMVDGGQQMMYPTQMQSISPQSSIDSVEETDCFDERKELGNGEDQYQSCSRKSQNDLGELQALAVRMMRN